MGKVSFKRGTSEQYASKVPDNDTIYFLTDTGEICLGSEVYSSMYETSKINNKMTVGVSLATKRYLGATQILNPLWLDRAVMICGCLYNTSDSKTYVYLLLASPDGINHVSKLLWEVDSQNDPYELTLENAPKKGTVAAANYQKSRLSFTNITSTFDVRAVRILYDDDGNEIERIYSAQYRYTLNNGVFTRTRVTVASTSPEYIVDAGVAVMGNSVGQSMSFIDYPNTMTYSPLVNIYQSTPWYFVITDDMFVGAEFGLQMVVVDGVGRVYRGPTFEKAPDDYEGEIYEIYDGAIEVG